MRYRGIGGIKTASGWVLLGFQYGIGPVCSTLAEAMKEIDQAYETGALRRNETGRPGL